MTARNPMAPLGWNRWRLEQLEGARVRRREVRAVVLGILSGLAVAYVLQFWR